MLKLSKFAKIIKLLQKSKQPIIDLKNTEGLK